jgi:hypothetical protein
MPHPAWTLLLAVLIALAAALPGDASPRRRVCRAAYTCCSSMAAVVAGGWLMYFIHG